MQVRAERRHRSGRDWAVSRVGELPCRAPNALRVEQVGPALPAAFPPVRAQVNSTQHHGIFREGFTHTRARTGRTRRFPV